MKREPEQQVRRTLERIYREHRQGLYTLALSITRDPQRAEDAVQEAFARLCRTPARPRGDPVAYTFAAVRNAAIDDGRRQARSPGTPASIFNGQATDAPGPQAQAIGAELQRLVRQAVEQLPDDQRQAIVLRLYAGLTFEQIAATSGEPLSTVASRYRRALQSIRQQMESLR